MPAANVETVKVGDHVAILRGLLAGGDGVVVELVAGDAPHVIVELPGGAAHPSAFRQMICTAADNVALVQRPGGSMFYVPEMWGA